MGKKTFQNGDRVVLSDGFKNLLKSKIRQVSVEPIPFSVRKKRIKQLRAIIGSSFTVANGNTDTTDCVELEPAPLLYDGLGYGGDAGNGMVSAYWLELVK